MRRTSLLIAVFAALALAVAPGLAFARAGSSGGGGASMGSRGSRTYTAPPATNTAPGVATPMQRSITPTPAAPAPAAGMPGYAAPRPGLFGGGFMSGLMGGMIGAGIGGLLFGHGLFHGVSGFGGFLGFLIQIVLIVVLVRFLYRLFFRRAQPAFAGPQAMPLQAMPAGGAPMGGGGPAQPAIAIQPADYAAFEQLLQGVQAAWSRHDINALRGLATPEMASYFAEQMAEQVSRGVHNMTSDIRLQKGDLAEAWAEPGREYATVAMRFSMIDVTTDAAGRVVEGSASEHVEATEIWTFVRAPGGAWLLSAIQQSR
jgi:predicted lipid-binding transport protein (Tim44 family)